MRTVIESYDLGDSTKFIYSDGSVEIVAKIVDTPAQKAAKLAAYNSGVSNMLTNQQLNIKLQEIKKFFETTMGFSVGSTFNFQWTSFFKTQFHNKLTAARLTDYNNWYAVTRSTSTGLLSDFGRAVDQLVDQAPIVQVLAPTLVLAGEAAKHPVEAAFITGAAVLAAPYIAPLISAGVPEALAPVVTQVQTAAGAVITGAAKNALDQALGNKPPAPVDEVIQVQASRPKAQSVPPWAWLFPAALFLLI